MNQILQDDIEHAEHQITRHKDLNNPINLKYWEEALERWKKLAQANWKQGTKLTNKSGKSVTFHSFHSSQQDFFDTDDVLHPCDCWGELG